jgi:hypothetical protein
LYDIGVKAASAEVKENHFADTFKL